MFNKLTILFFLTLLLPVYLAANNNPQTAENNPQQLESLSNPRDLDNSKESATISTNPSINTQGQYKANLETEMDQSFFDLLITDFQKMTNLHPLVVHFPIALIVISFPIFLLGLKTEKKDLKTIGLVIFMLGFIGALCAAYFFTPHPDIVKGQVKKVLELHTIFGKSTVVLAALTTLMCFVYFKLSAIDKYQPTPLPKKLEKPIAVAIFITMISVGITGHLGGTLTHIYEIKTKGVQIDFSTPMKNPTSTPW